MWSFINLRDQLILNTPYTQLKIYIGYWWIKYLRPILGKSTIFAHQLKSTFCNCLSGFYALTYNAY